MSVWKGCAIIVAMLAGASAAWADVPRPLDRVNFALGAFYPTIDTSVAANGTGTAGSEVNFVDDLGLDKHRTLANARLEFLVFDSQGFSIGGYRYSRSAAGTLARDIVFDGNTYSVDADVASHASLDTWNAAWHWWFAAGPDDVFGIGLGAAYYRLAVSIDGTTTVNGGSVSARGAAAADAIAPLLTIGWRHAFSDELRCYADFSGVRKPSGTLTGHLLNGALGLEYYPWRNLGFALEYSANNLDLKADKASWVGRARIHFYGPAAFVRLRF